MPSPSGEAPRRDERGLATARAAARPLRVVRVARPTVRDGLGLVRPRVLGHRRLREHDRARGTQARDDGRVFARHVALSGNRSAEVRHARDGERVLDRHRQAEQAGPPRLRRGACRPPSPSPRTRSASSAATAFTRACAASRQLELTRRELDRGELCRLEPPQPLGGASARVALTGAPCSRRPRDPRSSSVTPRSRSDELLHLAVLGQRQLVDDLDVARDREVGEPGLAVPHQLDRIELDALPQHDARPSPRPRRARTGRERPRRRRRRGGAAAPARPPRPRCSRRGGGSRPSSGRGTGTSRRLAHRRGRRSGTRGCASSRRSSPASASSRSRTRTARRRASRARRRSPSGTSSSSSSTILAS